MLVFENSTIRVTEMNSSWGMRVDHGDMRASNGWFFRHVFRSSGRKSDVCFLPLNGQVCSAWRIRREAVADDLVRHEVLHKM